MTSFYSGIPAFLDNDEWRDVIQSAAESRSGNNVGFRQDYLLCSYTIIFPLYGLLSRCIALISPAVSGYNQYEDKQKGLLEKLASILTRAKQAYERLLSYEPATRVKEAGKRRGSKDQEQIYMSALWKSYHDLMRVFFLFYRRLYVALGGTAAHATELELQKVARDLLHEYSKPWQTIPSLRVAIMIKPVSQSIVKTSQQWCDYTSQTSNKSRLVSATMFYEWLQMTGFRSMQ